MRAGWSTDQNGRGNYYFDGQTSIPLISSLSNFGGGMRDIFYITLFSLLITACDATYRVKRDLDVARPLQRTCVEDQVYSNLNDAFTRFEEINNEKHWKFSWIYKYRLSGEITQRSKPDGTMTIDINSSGVIAPSSPKEFEAEVAAQLDKLVSAIKSNCHLENVHVKKLSK